MHGYVTSTKNETMLANEKQMLQEQYRELKDECISDAHAAELQDDLLQVLDAYRYLFGGSRFNADKELSV